ncbi:MAG: alpha-L-rhamnosidase C-terminal domain-containing protein [Bacteroidales bacterium]|nr:alpha-L-rhamnosidase C-terminal domain-containing protein [Bacteroidales bacterium]
MKIRFAIFIISVFLFGCNSVSNLKTEQKIEGLYPSLKGTFGGKSVAESPDPLVAYRWANPQADDELESYTLMPVSMSSDALSGSRTSKKMFPVRIEQECDLMFDFGQVNAGWLEFDSDDLNGEIEMSISEFKEPAVFNVGAQHPRKTAKPVRHGNTYRLELNRELYEGVRFGWIHIKQVHHPFTISSVRLVCQIKPTNYEGSFSCSDPVLTRIWYTGAYDVKLNLLKDYFGAILMERSDRHSWTGDAHTSQAASMVAFGNYDFVKKNLFYTSTQFNGIASYSLYWVLSLIDYYNYTGDRETLETLTDNACQKLDIAYEHYEKNPNLVFYGWDERLGAGFENPNCLESRNAYKMVSIRAWNEFSKVMEASGRVDLAKKYRSYVKEKSQKIRQNPEWEASMGVFAASDAVNAGFMTVEEKEAIWERAFADRLQRLSYSPFNQYFIIQAMASMNKYDEALTTIDDCWGGQIRYGGTTFFEVYRPSWNSVISENGAPVNNQCGYTSLTHPWSAGITKWLSEEILGVKPLTPGFATFSVKPRLSRDLTSVSGSVPTLSGQIFASFDLLKGHGEVIVPSGTSASIGVPKAGRVIKKAALNGKVSPADREDEEYIYYDLLPAGKYKIKVWYSGELPLTAKENFHYTYNEIPEQDSVTQGNWNKKYGTEGYILCNYDGNEKNRIRLPEFVEDVEFKKNGNIRIAENTSDTRALMSGLPDNSQRNIGSIFTLDPHACNQTMTVDIKCKEQKNSRIALYFVDWERDGRRSAIEVFDLNDMKLLMPVQIVDNYGEGKYIVFNIDRSVRLRINQVRGVNASLSAIFFD